jgi:ABC-type multidrug transport system ATPase subunit
VLDGVSGKLQAGKLLAIMGPSGSGKTSLLNALAGRVPLTSKDDLLSGGVTVNGQPQPDMSKISAYVMQDDNLFALSSVRQTLMFAAQLRMPSSMPLKEKEEHVDAIIAKLGLTPARDTIIGSAKARGVSGGERKRVSIVSARMRANLWCLSLSQDGRAFTDRCGMACAAQRCVQGVELIHNPPLIFLGAC